ncbi:hypothetical protein FRB95_005478 [Tulasnella sp. JGI-2019a]|nr:hypothetical protein FRB95_005478 [Tulasnella sp. JGI-2019a]
MQFAGSAYFSPSVPLEVKKTWIKGGGTLARRYSTTNWFFYNGVSDPDLIRFSRRPIIRYDCWWIIACQRSKALVCESPFVLRDDPLPRSKVNASTPASPKTRERSSPSRHFSRSLVNRAKTCHPACAAPRVIQRDPRSLRASLANLEPDSTTKVPSSKSNRFFSSPDAASRSYTVSCDSLIPLTSYWAEDDDETRLEVDSVKSLIRTVEGVDANDPCEAEDEAEVERICIVVKDHEDSDKEPSGDLSNRSVSTLVSSTSTAASKESHTSATHASLESDRIKKAKHKKQALKLGLKIVHFLDPDTSKSRVSKWSSAVKNELQCSHRIIAAENGFPCPQATFSASALLSLSNSSLPCHFDHITEFKPGIMYRDMVFSARPRISRATDDRKDVS